MKSIKHFILLFAAAFAGAFSACATNSEPEQPATGSDANVITIYFSCTGHTQGIAEKIHNAAGGDLLRIEPVEPYTSADLDYNTDCRANREQNNPSARPAIKTALPSMESYDVVFLGYPIWWGKAPKIIYTLLESADFSGKTIIPFCTSGSSGIGGSESDLHALAPGATWVAGRRFESNASQSAINEWVKSVMPQPAMGSYKMNITVNGTTMTATMAANSSTAALKDLLLQGDITIEMEDYSNFEKVGELPKSLPRNDEQITTQPGDLILYLGNRFVIYYATNSWNFTRLGKIDNLAQSQLKAILGPGDCVAVLSLNDNSGIAGTSARNEETAKYFDMQGRKTDANSKGIGIDNNGKKHLR